MSPNRRDQTKTGKILVVDDEPAEREGLARLVGQWGYEVETASSGQEAPICLYWPAIFPAVASMSLAFGRGEGLRGHRALDTPAPAATNASTLAAFASGISEMTMKAPIS